MLHAVKLTAYIYMVLADSEWSGPLLLRLSPTVSGIYLNRHGFDYGFDEHGQQRIALPARIGCELPVSDAIMNRSGSRHVKAESEGPLLLSFAEGFAKA